MMSTDLSILIPKLRSKQNELRSQLKLQKIQTPIHVIAGCDSALIGDDIFSVFVIFSYPDLQEIEVQTHQSPLPLPYIPGFLAFREVPNLLKTYEKIQHKPDLIFVDGQGIMHPRRMGIATYLGIVLNVPTIGVGKSRLFGTYIEPKKNKESFSYVYDKNEILGIALRSKDNLNPLFISPGHLCDVESAHHMVLSTLRGYKLPEPTRIADKYSKSLKLVKVAYSQKTMLTPHTPAPDFSLPDQDGKLRTLEDFKGSWLVLYFYPKDDTPGCTTEACSFRDNFTAFTKKGIAVVGISKDTVKSHKKFEDKYDLPFILLADPEKITIQAYGAWGKKKFMGREFDGTLRTTFLINPKGMIAKVYEGVKPSEHAELILQDYESLIKS